MMAFNPTTVDIPPYGVVQLQWDAPSKWTKGVREGPWYTRPTRKEEDGSVVVLVYPHQSGVSTIDNPPNTIATMRGGNGAELSSWRYQDPATMAVAGPNGILAQRYGEVRTDWPLLARVRKSDVGSLRVGEDLATSPFEWEKGRDATRNDEAFDLRRVQDGAFVCVGVDAGRNLALVEPRTVEKPQPMYLAYTTGALSWTLGSARDGQMHVPTSMVSREDGEEYETDRGVVHIIHPGAYVFGYAMTLRTHDFITVLGLQSTVHHQWSSGILYWNDYEYDSAGSSSAKWALVERGYALGSGFFDNLLLKQTSMGVYAGLANGPDYPEYGVLPVKSGEFFCTNWATGFMTISNPIHVMLGADCGTHGAPVAAAMVGRTVVPQAHLWFQRIGTHANGLHRLRVNGRTAIAFSATGHEIWHIDPSNWSR